MRRLNSPHGCHARNSVQQSSRSRFGYHLCWLPLLIVTFIGFVYGIRHGVYALVGDVYEHESWMFIFGRRTIAK